MRRGARRAVATAAAVLAAVLVPEAAFAATAPVLGGADVSRKQGTTLPPIGDFAVVALNTGLPTETNPSLVPQLQWAATASGAGHNAVDVYLASANPGLAAAWWPSSDTTRAGTPVRPPSAYKTCRHTASMACAWVYGNSIGRDDVQRLPAGTSIGTWWIDVEGGADGNTWSSSTSRNRAVVEGMVAGLKASKKRVGLYAASAHFREVLGAVPATSSVTKLPFWAAGSASEAAALTRCSGASLTSGRLVLAQWTDDGGLTDHDVACGVLTQPKPTISGKYHVGRKLAAKVKPWGPSGVRLTYRWTRDGHPIGKATHRTYTLKKADRRHRIGVTVTGTLTGYSRAVQKSATHRIGS